MPDWLDLQMLAAYMSVYTYQVWTVELQGIFFLHPVKSWESEQCTRTSIGHAFPNSHNQFKSMPGNDAAAASHSMVDSDDGVDNPPVLPLLSTLNTQPPEDSEYRHKEL